MMKICVVGGGPAGLYFALLTKKRIPSTEIQVVEQNQADQTYGWGIVLSYSALALLRDHDESSFADIANCVERWRDLVIDYKGRQVSVGENEFFGISRKNLLHILQGHCLRNKVDLQFGRRIKTLDSFAGFDFVVAADGAHSSIRQEYSDQFQTTSITRPNKFIWYGTDRVFDALTLSFRENQDGFFTAHAYRYDKIMSTFLIECDSKTAAKAGIGLMSDVDSRRYCESLFRDILDGHRLLANDSVWSHFVEVRNRFLSHGNIVLIGDALRTIHHSIGSGTRCALEDAAVLSNALLSHSDLNTAIKSFQASREWKSAKFQEAARRSYRWYENLPEKFQLDLLPFVYDLMLRTELVDPEGLRERIRIK